MGNYEIRPFERGYLVVKKENGFIYDICETYTEAEKIKEDLEMEIIDEKACVLDF